MPTVYEALEATAGRKVRRDISRLVTFARGNLEKAARSIAQHPRPHVGIVAGFSFVMPSHRLRRRTV